MFRYLNWSRLVEEQTPNQRRYFEQPGVPHIVLDDLLDERALDGLDEELHTVLHSPGLGRYEYVNQNTESSIGVSGLPPISRAIIEELHSKPFVTYLTGMTRIAGLVPDPDLANGGIFVLRPGGFMNLHQDETIHPFRNHWRRRVNLVLYLNRSWKEEYQGHLQLYARDGCTLVRRVLPTFNRCFISTIDRNVHGMPGVVRCPDGEARKSVSLWYYTVEASPVPFRPVAWKPQPGDPLGLPRGQAASFH
jgi:hypothetical protein